MTPFDAIVLAGGGSTRMGGRDKALVMLAGKTLLERAVEAVAAARRTIVVGPEREVPFDVIWTRESPAGGGPVAGLAAGMAHVGEDMVVVLAVDMPLVDRDLVAELIRAAATGDGAVAVDEDGRPQPLAATYRVTALRTALSHLPELDGASMRALLGDLNLARVPAGGRTLDCDEPEDVWTAEELIDRPAAPGS